MQRRRSPHSRKSPPGRRHCSTNATQIVPHLRPCRSFQLLANPCSIRFRLRFSAARLAAMARNPLMGIVRTAIEVVPFGPVTGTKRSLFCFFRSRNPLTCACTVVARRLLSLALPLKSVSFRRCSEALLFFFSSALMAFRPLRIVL